MYLLVVWQHSSVTERENWDTFNYMCLRIYLWCSAFFSLSSLRKVCRKPKILNTMWCCCFYLLSSFQIQYKLYEKWHNFSCKLEAARTGENKMWASLLVLVVLFSDHTHPPSSSRLHNRYWKLPGCHFACCQLLWVWPKQIRWQMCKAIDLCFNFYLF